MNLNPDNYLKIDQIWYHLFNQQGPFLEWLYASNIDEWNISEKLLLLVTQPIVSSNWPIKCLVRKAAVLKVTNFNIIINPLPLQGQLNILKGHNSEVEWFLFCKVLFWNIDPLE